MKKLYNKLTTRTVNEPYSTNTNPEKIMFAAVVVAIIGLFVLLYLNNFYSL